MPGLGELMPILALLLVIGGFAVTLITTPWGLQLALAMGPKPLKRISAVFLALVTLNMLREAAVW